MCCGFDLLFGVLLFCFGGVRLLCDVFGEFLFGLCVVVCDVVLNCGMLPINGIVCLISGVFLFGGCIWMVWWFVFVSKCLLFFVWLDALFRCQVLSGWAVVGCVCFVLLSFGCIVVWL